METTYISNIGVHIGHIDRLFQGNYSAMSFIHVFTHRYLHWFPSDAKLQYKKPTILVFSFSISFGFFANSFLYVLLSLKENIFFEARTPAKFINSINVFLLNKFKNIQLHHTVNSKSIICTQYYKVDVFRLTFYEKEKYI